MPEYFAHNTLTTQNLIQGLMAVSKPFRVFFASSVHVYGNQSSEADESSEVTPEGYYGMSKYLSERALEEFAKQRPDIRVVVGRLYSCIGPNQPPGFVTSDLTTKLASLTNNSLLETGPLSAYRRFLDVRDAVEILVRLVESDQTNGFEIVNIASPFEMKVQEIVEKLVAVSGKKVRIQSRETDQNPFKGLKISLRKQEKLVPGFSFRPLETTLQDIWNSVHIRESA